MCIMCDGASRDEALFDLHARISRFGWAVQGVEGGGPPVLDWAYTVGLAQAFDHPELAVVVESGEVPTGFRILNEVAQMVRAGLRFDVGDTAYVAGGLVGFGAVHPVQIERGLVATWLDYYGSLGPPVPYLDVLQVVLPDGTACHQHQQSIPLLADPVTNVGGTSPAPPNRAERRARARRR